jgi:hypothetical protein
MNLKFFSTILVAGSLAFAQGPRGPQHDNPARGGGSGLDMTKVQTVEGTVSAVNIGYGSQYPSIQIGEATIKVAPVWFLLESDFEIKTGDKLKVTAAPSLQAKDPYLSTVALTNLVSNATLSLRDSSGIPLWTRGSAAGENRQGPGTCGACGLTSVATVSGTVDQINAGAGIQMPSLVLKTADGKLIAIKIGPERILLAADFEMKAGDALTVKYGVNCEGENAGIELTNAAGQKVVLRNENGWPGWR